MRKLKLRNKQKVYLGRGLKCKLRPLDSLSSISIYTTVASQTGGSSLNIVNVASVLWAGTVDYGRNQKISPDSSYVQEVNLLA